MAVTDLAELDVSRRAAGRRLVQAMGRNRAFSLAGLSERLFAQLFKGLVYAQIWEDPAIDMEAMEVQPGDTIVAIASGGCNALSYLTADPGRVELVDLNPAHVAYVRLKIAAAGALPCCDSFFRFFGRGDDMANIAAYETHLRPLLDTESKKHWDGRDWSGRRRIDIFARNPYRHGALGRFIGLGHRAARLYGVDLGKLLEARTLDEQREQFDRVIAPLFERPLVRWATRRKSALFGLGIPPQQYDALAGAGQPGEGGMAQVLRERLEKLACGFPFADNYFAWQAFGRRYQEGGALPPYLQRQNYDAVKRRADRVSIVNRSLTELLAAKPDGSVNRFVLLDAQDWMTDAQLNEVWREITRTAAPGARVIFRTADRPNLLPGRVSPSLLERWDYRAEQSADLHARDRSSIYGGFHLHVLKDA